MSATTRVNPALAQNSGRNHGVLYSQMQLKAFIVDAGATLASQTGIDGAIEALTRELGTTAALFESSGTAGKFIVIGDGHALDAAILAIRIQQLGTVNGYSFAGATVSELTSLFAVSAS